MPILQVGDVAVVHHTGSIAISNPAQAGAEIDCGRERLSRVRLRDADEVMVPTDRFTADLDAGTVTLANPLDLTGYTQPLALEHVIEDMALVTDVEISGAVTLSRPLSHDYPDGSQISSALIITDMFARYTKLFSQGTWTSEWADAVIGTPPVAQFNDVQYPVEITNKGAIQERWAVIFTSASTYRVIGEHVGQIISSGNTSTDCEPINPATNTPYFLIPWEGWGGGWSTGNVLRFNTVAANCPLWIARSVLQSNPSVGQDSFTVEIRGNIDAD